MLTFAPQFRKTGVSSKTIERQGSRRVEIARGLRDGIPIALGYFAVAFSLGIIAKKAGLTAILGFMSRGLGGRVWCLYAGGYQCCIRRSDCDVSGDEPALYADECGSLAENRACHLMGAPSADGLLHHGRGVWHLREPSGLYAACLYLFCCLDIDALLGFGLCCGHRGWRDAACAYRLGAQRGQTVTCSTP